MRGSRLARLARWCDMAVSSLAVAAGLVVVAWVPGDVLRRVVSSLWPDVPRITMAVTILRMAIAALVVVWAKLSMQRIQPATPPRCSINVHVYADELAPTCICGCTGDVADESDGAP